MSSPARNTIARLQELQHARARGYRGSFTTDPAWLLDMAINRRAGWPDDPSHFRGSCMPVGGRYPKKAEGLELNHLRQLADRINTPRLIVRPPELGEWRRLLLSRLPHRFTTLTD